VARFRVTREAEAPRMKRKAPKKTEPTAKPVQPKTVPASPETKFEDDFEEF